MRITPNSFPQPVSFPINPQTRTSPQGSVNPSSFLEIHLRANGSEGLCGWLQSLIEKAWQFLSRLFASAPVTSSTQNLLEERVAAAKEVIASHFRAAPIVRADADSVIITAVKYQGRSDLSYGLTGTMRRSQDLINGLANRLLARAPHAEKDNSQLEIHTLLLTKNPRNLFYVDSWRRFGDITYAGGGNVNGPLTRNALVNYLDPVITSVREKIELGEFVSRWDSSF